mmetsp:Transcript_18812/g.32345  ORF Transcript_18812/g.32345 Transcript_18812/m.32345 type:complete len:313 (+) Transcript_18812:204-1142(+)
MKRGSALPTNLRNHTRQMFQCRRQLIKRGDVSGFHASVPIRGVRSIRAIALLLRARIQGLLDQNTVHLINVSLQLPIQYQRYQQTLHVLHGNVVEVPCNPREAYPRVRPDVPHDDLRSYRAEQIRHVLPHEFVVHEPPLVLFQDAFEFANVVVVEGVDQIGHGDDLGIVPVRAGLVAVKGIDATGVEHGRHDQIFEASQPTPIPRLVVALERLEEGLAGVVEISLAHVHLPPQFLDEGEGAGMGDAAPDGHGAMVRRAELFGVLETRVELDLESGDFHDVRAPCSVVGAIHVGRGGGDVPLQNVRGLPRAEQ